MLLTGSLKLYYPNSGPGSKFIVKGDVQAGYFGEVSSYELFSTNQLRDDLNFSFGSVYGNIYSNWRPVLEWIPN